MSTSESKKVRRSDIFFAEKDRALRKDVHRLGELVGDLVKDQLGEVLFDLVEAVRRAAIESREGDTNEIDQLDKLLSSLTPNNAGDFIRAFSTYFQAVNMAEKVHRIRRRRAYLKDSDTPQPLGFADTLRRLKANGVNGKTVEKVLGTLSIEPVFTAHPTETTRRTLLRKQQNIARYLIGMLDPYMTSGEEQAALDRIRTSMTAGWQTEEQPAERMTVGDEVEQVLFFLTDVLYKMIPRFYEDFDDALEASFKGEHIHVPILVRFSSWVGGDMDGNPNVTAKDIRETLARQRNLILNKYYSECQGLFEQLSQSDSQVNVSEEVRQRSALYAEHFPKAAHSVPARYRQMPYRVFLRAIEARLQSTYDGTAFPYESAEEFTADIELIAGSLRANKGKNAGLFSVQRLLRRVRTFGFHMATLDIRQNALVHQQVIGEALGEKDWLGRSSEDRTKRLKIALERRESPLEPLSSEARRALAVFQAIAHCRRKYGVRSIGSYVISMAQGPDDILSVLLLAKWGDLAPKGGAIPLDITPLFETVKDLENASMVMERLLKDDTYKEHLKNRSGHQTIMVGYSDSNKDGGLASARWTLQKTQAELVKILSMNGTELTLFHGRGGTVSRGGGRVNEAIKASPPGAIAGRLRVTEQGEMVNAKFGLRAIAMRTLERTVSSVLWVSASKRAPHPEESRWESVMETIASASHGAYQKTIYDSADFSRYFREATPIDVIERLDIGSRPVSRVEDGEIRSLRAIPWVFAWTQSRFLLPGWFGIGTGLEEARNKHGDAVLKEMFDAWDFFKVLLCDVEVVLGKTDINIAERYSELAGKLHCQYFPIIRDEYDRSIDLVLQIREQNKLLENDETLRRSIRLRNPYVDPMSLLQVTLLKRWRLAGREDDATLKALKASVHGIAYGMQNTG